MEIGECMNRKYLGTIVDVEVDIRLGEAHPEYPDTIYKVNYGHIPNTVSGDGEELDAYIFGVDYPVDSFKGKVIAILHRINDDDDKLIVVAGNKNYTDKEIKETVNFIEQYFESIIIR